MSIDDRRNEIRTTVEKLISGVEKRTRQEVLDCFSDDIVCYEVGLGRTYRGKKELADLFAVFSAAIPDLQQNDFGIFFGQERQAAISYTFSGTLEGDLPGFPSLRAKNRRFSSIQGATFWEFADDHRISKEVAYWDRLQLLDQLGMPMS